MLQQAFIFITKIIFASGWIDPEVFEERQKYADIEVKKLRDQGRWKEAWDLAVKWRQQKNIVDHDGSIFYFITPGL